MQDKEKYFLLKKMNGLRLTGFLKKYFHGKWVLPMNKTHIILGTPGLNDNDKTFMEPDGSFSPGVGSYGITVWVYNKVTKRFYAPEEFLFNDLSFTLVEGYLPVACSKWNAGSLQIEINVFVGWERDDQKKITDYAKIRVLNFGKEDVNAWLYIAIRSLGPAGGPINSISFDYNNRIVNINNKQAIQYVTHPESFGSTSFSHEEDDISLWAKRGEIPEASSIEDTTQLGLVSGAARYDINIKPSEQIVFGLQAAVNTDLSTTDFCLDKLQDNMSKTMSWWRSILKTTELSFHDTFWHDAFYASLGHLLNLSVDNQVRVSNITYPKVYLRDGVFMINAIDKSGLHDLADSYIKYLINHMWTSAASQEGPEADEPGALGWVIMEHYRLTHDINWLQSMYPVIKRCADLIIFLWEAEDGQAWEEQGVKFLVKGNKVFASMKTDLWGMPLDFNVLFAEREDGVIYGRLDLIYQTEWVVPWHIAALQGALEAAEALERSDDMLHYKAKCDSYRKAYQLLSSKKPMSKLATIGIWPCRALDTTVECIGDISLKDSYSQVLTENVHELDEGSPMSNKYTFFQAAHNLLLMGHRKYVLEHFLKRFKYSPKSREALGTYAIAEFTDETYQEWWKARYWTDLWSEIRGWENLGFNIPHGWSSAEFILLLRDMLFFEWEDTIVLAEGIVLDELPDEREISVKNASTYFGKLDYSLIKNGNSIVINIGGTAKPPKGYLLRLTEKISINNIFIDNNKTMDVSRDRIFIPNGTKEVKIKMD